MAEYIASQGGHLLNIEAKYYNKLDIEGFSQMMKNPATNFTGWKPLYILFLKGKMRQRLKKSLMK